ncbi:MAG: O-acetyl-ADP-ribose deacetylase [Thermodesulfobacteriota bacterium]
MEVKIVGVAISLVMGDITEEKTDAIVNAANSRLAGGGGVDGAIHRAGGPRIMEECRAIGGCPTGSAVVTSGGNLKAAYVIHTVGPVHQGGNRNEAALLASAYRSSLKAADGKGVKSIAFPSISTGVYGYPLRAAAAIALKTVIDFVEAGSGIKLIRFVLFSEEALDVYKETLTGMVGGSP